MSIKIGIFGSSGRMGKEIEQSALDKNHSVVYKFSLEEEVITEKPDVIVDFSVPELLNKSLSYALVHKLPIILGTTGYSLEELSRIKDASLQIPIVQSYNFSVGIQMMLKCTELLNSYLADWDIEITETHHRFKKDKPSGTAIMLKNAVGKNVNISSLRLGNISGEHSIYFAGLGEVISVNHSATSRKTFAEGVVRSIEYIYGKQSGFYTFKDVVFNGGN